MNPTPLGRNTALAGIAALALAAIPALAATGNPAAGGRSACASSTSSMQQLATIDNAGDGMFQCLGVSLEGGRVKALRVETHHAASRQDSERVEVAEFPLSVVESSRGAVLDGVPGHDAIILQGHFTSPPVEAELVASYLYNGFTSEYRSCRIALVRAQDAGWRLVNRRDQTVSHIVVRTREIPVIGMFGIANLEGACT
jgi:hypothetical protein